MSHFDDRMGVPRGTYSKQEELLRSGQLAYVVLGGKMASGKDTIGPMLSLPGDSLVLLSYGEVLRQELKKVLPVIESDTTSDRESHAELIADSLGYSLDNALALYNQVKYQLELDGHLDPWERTDFNRTLLQSMGSEWLPDDDYLPRTASKQAMGHIADGNSVVLTGGRFEPDVSFPSVAGAICVRLVVSRETQLDRLMSRDGLGLSDELERQMNHPGEIALDDYPMDVMVRNDNESKAEYVADEVSDAIRAILTDRSRSYAS